MAKKPLRRPSRAAVDRALREMKTLWRPPDPKKETTGPEVSLASAAEESKDNSKYTPTSDEPQPGWR